jgi:hypothetical protein
MTAMDRASSFAPLLACGALGFLLALGCGEPSRWTCGDWGSWRACSSARVAPPGDGWSCRAAGGDLVCSRPSWGAGWFGWACTRAGAATVCRAPGAATPPEASPDGWQGRVAGERVIATWRRAGNDPWRCAGDRCVERRPDRPSADEWECVEGDGRVLCRGRFLRGVDPRWTCAPLGERFLCLDADPDYPAPADPAAWKCSYADSRKAGRQCDRGAPVHAGPCPGTWHGGRCQTVRVAPECWLDADCAGSRSCRVGFCVPP